MDRRQFIITTAAAGVAGLASPVWLNAADAGVMKPGQLDELMHSLLRDWCDALVRLQVVDPAQPKANGALRCPACGFFHGRCGDAVLPLLAMADRTGESRYLDAALRLATWMKNVSAEDGSWTNELDPKSWKGTTVFTAIVLAEALEWYGKLLDEPTRRAWRDRLRKAGEFILTLEMESADKRVTIAGKGAPINYAASGIYALALLGRLLDDERLLQRSAELAPRILAYFTPQNRLLFGEGNPNQKTAKNGYPIDLAYNVEESLPNLVHYALLIGDQKILDMAVASFKTHLEFMLPDGAWDNSWGTRSFKWTYWGSRTSDGCQAALVRLAERDPVFATAAIRNAELYRACTHNGLLHGGPHYASHGVEPCVHHTFVHAKALAGALHFGTSVKSLLELPPLPRQIAHGVKHFPEMDVFLAAIGPWRATISGCDCTYKEYLFQATGGALGILWHEKLGPLLSASLAQYRLVEKDNMQPAPDGEDFPLTVRVERRTPDGLWFTNLFDRTATIRSESTARTLRFVVEAKLVSAESKNPSDGVARIEIVYTLTREQFAISARPLDKLEAGWALVLPVIAKSSEPARQTAANRWEIAKDAGRLVVAADSAIDRVPSRRDRVFNHVPGFEALPLRLVSSGSKPVECTLQFRS